MEAKQSAKRVAVKKADPCQPDLIPEDATQIKAGTATRGTGRWDRVMRAAKKQAEDYARALPKEHGWPPFILVVDVGHVIEVYADFSGQGKNYAQFPDRDGYSIPLEGLRDRAIRDRLRAIWSAPHTLDPAKRSAEVTRDIAERLARVARSLEGKHDPKEVAEFLMRCLFTMFAEDVGLLPKQGFEKLLGEMVETPEHFAPAVESLWAVMDEGGYAPHLNATIKRFNGTLFRKRKGDRVGEGRYPRAPDRRRARLARCRARHLRDAAGARARQAGARQARRPLHAARLCRARWSSPRSSSPCAPTGKRR